MTLDVNMCCLQAQGKVMTFRGKHLRQKQIIQSSLKTDETDEL